MLSVRFLVPILTRRNIVDYPGERTSHTIVAPRGGGIGIGTAIVLGFGILSFFDSLPISQLNTILFFTAMLGLISWLDDLKPLNPALRISIHTIAVVASLIFHLVPMPPILTMLLGPTVAIIAVGIGWVWFINLYNFMDGIDGITGVETITICIGIATVVWVSGDASALMKPALIIGAATAGFLVWNWHPAKIFMGDVGSIPLGFIIGWMLLEIAAAGQWAAALILPAYYLADATITLVRRGLRGEKIWQAHKEHFYQRAHQRGLSHAAVSLRILMANFLLIGLAITAAIGYPFPSLVGAALVVGFLLFHLAGSGKTTA